MRALVYHGAEDIRCESVDDPRPRDLDSAVVRVERAGICGSDLHIYHGHGFSPDPGYVIGHEAIGEVVEVGSGVRRFRVGDRVLIPGSTGCSTCSQCRRGHVARCESASMGCYGLSHALPGSQAEAVAVPAADTGLTLIPDGISDEQAILLTDNLPTAWFGARRAGIVPGDSVAVVGLGPVGLCAVASAFALGASRVFAIDLIESRRAHAATLGAEPIHAEDPVAAVREHTKGIGVDRVVEAVGLDATIRVALQLARTEGSVSVVGVSQSRRFDFDMALAQVRSLSFHIGLCSVQAELPALIPLVRSGRIDPSRFVSHRMDLSEGALAYRLFANRSDEVRKVILDPSR
jgi:2-desacetyl-2-hydroxyethyl bacteriochlorophyllide A dehydrogenase